MDERNIRTLVAAVQGGVTRAVTPAATDDDKQSLTRAWDALVQHLALGPAPDMRACPRCGRDVMRAATLCGYCWSKLTPAVAVGQ